MEEPAPVAAPAWVEMRAQDEVRRGAAAGRRARARRARPRRACRRRASAARCRRSRRSDIRVGSRCGTPRRSPESASRSAPRASRARSRSLRRVAEARAAVAREPRRGARQRAAEAAALQPQGARGRGRRWRARSAPRWRTRTPARMDVGGVPPMAGPRVSCRATLATRNRARVVEAPRAAPPPQAARPWAFHWAASGRRRAAGGGDDHSPDRRSGCRRCRGRTRRKSRLRGDRGARV